MNAWWLCLIIPVSLAVGIVLGGFLASWYLLNTLKKALGIKSWKEFHKKMEEIQKFQEQMKKGQFSMSEDLRKKMEEIAKQFSQ